MTDVIDDFTNSLSDKVRKSPKTFDFLEEINKLTLQIICHTAMGYRLNFDDPKANQYRQVNILTKSALMPFLEKLRLLYKTGQFL